MLFEINSKHFRATIEKPWETINKTEFRMTINNESKIIHVSGQSSREEDWPDNLDFRVKDSSKQWFPDVKDILVHAGFLRQYKSVREKLLDAAYQHVDYAVRVDGYSLGASWTQIYMQDILYRWPDRDVQAIFYAPGNPWKKLPKKYQNALKRRTTFVYCFWDPVTKMRLLGFHRYGKEITIGKRNRIRPLQHKPDQIIRGLDEKFKGG
jgi:predicted lipase